MGLFEVPEFVRDLNDGKMGSISFDIEKVQCRNKQIAAAEYIDSDGILVEIELTCDKNGKLFELDFWKVNFSQLRIYPNIENLKIKPVKKI